MRAASALPGTTRAARRSLDDAIEAALGNNGGAANNGAIDELARGKPQAAMVKLEQVVDDLLDASARGVELTAVQRLVGLIGRSVATGAVDRAAANATRPADVRKVEDGRALVATADAHLAAARYEAAMHAYRNAVQAVQSLL